ncbi:MAG: PH domain-containing protein [Acidimicrobiia bacterium]|nr:PH domain-containing protein [Acidimicrobiia bacterium]
MRWPENSLTENESIVTSFRPHWKVLAVRALIVVAAIVVAGLVDWAIDGGSLIVWSLALIAILIAIVKPLVDWWFTRYVLTTERLITRKGLIAQSGIEIPLDRITNVNFSQTVIERMLGAGDLLVESAGETGQSQFSDIPHPDRFQATLYKVREARTIALGRGTEHQDRSAGKGAEAIRELAKLRDEGLISDEEYEAKRAKLLREL